MYTYEVVDGYLVRTYYYVDDVDSEIYNVKGHESGQSYGDSFHFNCNLSDKMLESMYPKVVAHITQLEKNAKDLGSLLKESQCKSLVVLFRSGLTRWMFISRWNILTTSMLIA